MNDLSSIFIGNNAKRISYKKYFSQTHIMLYKQQSIIKMV